MTSAETRSRTAPVWPRPAVAVLGLLAAARRRTGSINVNWADDALHGLTAAAGLVLGIFGARATARIPKGGHA